MDCLADTNIILRLAQPAHPMHAVALRAVKTLLSQGHNLCLTPQNLIEFWNVATRPAGNNGLGRTAAQTEADVRAIESNFTILADSPAIYPEWRRLVVAHSILGKQVHDTRLVASMNVNQITQLLTFNGDDFKRFSNITIIDPAAV
ncbi:MAG: PIN domain-containing protein [Acidobacteria bacterium]|nr:PIN domain-containing protein [Acidobacteriota bacterium]